MNKETPEPVKIKTQEIELPKIDLNKYIGKKEIVESVNVFKGNFGYYVKMETSVIDVLQKGKEPLEIRASRIFGLYEDKDGKIGWGKDTKLGLFLTAKRLKHFDDMKGREVTVQLTDDGKFLTFI